MNLSTHPILAGVLGDPIAHSLSPRLHGHWIAQHGLNAHYVPLHVRPEDLADALSLLPRIGFAGVNITLPHKEAALALATHATERARRIRAANTLVFGAEGSIAADNTDAEGFLRALGDACPDWFPGTAPVVVLGAGGAARAVVVALQETGVSGIRLVNRNLARARALADDLGPGIEPLQWPDAEAALDGAGLLVNTTSLGMHGQPALDLGLDRLSPEAPVADIVYVPLLTPLLMQAAQRGHPVVDGLGMLLHQARPGFERWFGQAVQVDDALRAAVLAGTGQ